MNAHALCANARFGSKTRHQRSDNTGMGGQFFAPGVLESLSLRGWPEVRPTGSRAAEHLSPDD
eukprot:scaffold571864_cov36-Prasinocladus_malaysianus.AAC.1